MAIPRNRRTAALALLVPLLLGTAVVAPAATNQQGTWHAVSGTGVHRFTSALIHSHEPTGTGFVQRSTDIVELDGDVRGLVLYQPVSTFDLEAGTLVNTGTQVFSGTVLGSAPVMLYDDRFRFDADLVTGATTGKVFLDQRIDGPGLVRCWLDIVGTGLDAQGDALIQYSGKCQIQPSLLLQGAQTATR